MTNDRVYTVNDGPDQTGQTETKENKKGHLKTMCCMQLFVLIVFALGVTGGILIGVYAYHGGPDGNQVTVNCPETSEQSGSEMPKTKATTFTSHSPPKSVLKTCPNPDPVKSSRYESSIYAPMTKKEMIRVSKWLFDNKYVTTVTGPKNLRENFILYQEIQPPIKKEALNHLDHGGAKPRRFAKVTIQRGNERIPDIMEYKVGPLGAVSMSATRITRPGEIHFNSRPYDYIESIYITELLRPSLETLAPLIKQSFDGATFEKDLFVQHFNGPPSTSGTKRDIRWCLGFKGFPTDDDMDMIHMLPVSGVVHTPGTNTSTWWANDFHYLNQGPFATAEDLMNAYKKNTIRKVRLRPGYRYTIRNRVFPKRDTSKPLRKHADKAGPRAYNPEGPRYEIHGTNVKWMDWNFDISGTQIRGPALFNIQFKGERIIYEHAVNDIALNYAMDSHAQNNIIYADATYGIMGSSTPTPVMLGVDCPEHGTVLNTTFWWHGAQEALDTRSICVFEADGQEALWRHGGNAFEAGLRNRYLAVRVPVVIGNYDYTFEFDFYLDGKIYTFGRASGFIQASFWDEHNPNTDDKTRDAFGYRLTDYHTGPIHDHTFGFKVDMDIIDKKNTFQVIKWKAGPALEALNTQKAISKAPPYFIYNETRYIEWERVERERGIQHPTEHQFWVVVNDREKNKWGVERGYQIAPLATGDQALKTHPLLKALSFTKYHCAVTKRKEEEPTLTSIYDVNRMDNPKQYLDSFINDEYIVDDDIVNWITVGFLHIPTSEDMPMTVKVETGFLIRPFNFFDRTATFDMPQHTETFDHILTESEPEHETCAEPEFEYCRFC